MNKNRKPNGATGVVVLRRLNRRRSVKNFLESVENGDTVGENAIRQQKSVEKIDGEETQVRKTFQQPFRCSVAYLRHLRVGDVHIMSSIIRSRSS